MSIKRLASHKVKAIVSDVKFATLMDDKEWSNISWILSTSDLGNFKSKDMNLEQANKIENLRNR